MLGSVYRHMLALHAATILPPAAVTSVMRPSQVLQNDGMHAVSDSLQQQHHQHHQHHQQQQQPHQQENHHHQHQQQQQQTHMSLDARAVRTSTPVAEPIGVSNRAVTPHDLLLVAGARTLAQPTRVDVTQAV